jgi:hypothetical protein
LKSCEACLRRVQVRIHLRQLVVQSSDADHVRFAAGFVE